jgi:predicted Fe-S protein YdhL (DUF1289 family)
MNSTPPPSSPCIKVCKYNDNNHCIGCKRHINEITQWNEYSNEMRHAIQKDLKKRIIQQPQPILQ